MEYGKTSRNFGWISGYCQRTSKGLLSDVGKCSNKCGQPLYTDCTMMFSRVSDFSAASTHSFPAFGVFPMQWKTAKVIALHKPGKKSYSEARAYQPISLLNHMGKLLESIVNTWLKNWLEKHQVLSLFQWGFCPWRHVQGAYWRLVEEVIFVIRARDQV